MNKYHFVKIKNVMNGGNGNWYLEANSIDTIKEHFRIYVGNEINEGCRQIINKNISMTNNIKEGHVTNNFARAVEILSSSNNISIIEASLQIENDILQHRINLYLKGEIQYLSMGLSCLLLSTTTKIIEDKFKDEMIYPSEENLNIEDVRYLQWDGGKHWYAKIGYEDIVDKNGNQKWDTKQEAEEASKWYIQNK